MAKEQSVSKEKRKASGRPKRPAELELYAKEAPQRLRAIADDPETPPKIKVDIERFFFESVYGKASQAVALDGEVKNTGAMLIRFEGALEEWSK